MMREPAFRPAVTGVFLASAASVAFQVELTRMFSLAQWYHFAFMVISLAMLGYGASGTLAARFSKRVKRHPGLPALSAAILALGILASPAAVSRIPFDPYTMGIERHQSALLAAQYLVLSIPFIAAGAIVALALMAFPGRTGKVYSSTMAGAGAAGIAIFILGNRLETPQVVLAVALGASLSCLCFSFSVAGRAARAAALALAVTLAVLLGVKPPGFLKVHISPRKSLSQKLQVPGAAVLATRWNAFSRIDLIRSPLIRQAPGMSYASTVSPPQQLGISVDGENIVGITPAMAGEAEPGFVRFLPAALPYEAWRPESVLLLSPRGGPEALIAASYRPETLVIVEPNPAVTGLLRDAALVGTDLYIRPGVTVVEESGRSFIRRTPQRFDLVTVALTDGFGPVSAGAFNLSENHLLTVEAIRDYFSVLTPGGVVAITRWMQYPPSESLRLAATIAEALETYFCWSAKEHLAAYRSSNTITVLARAQPFSDAERDSIRESCRQNRFDLVWLPGMSKDEANRYDSIDEPVYHDAYRVLLTEGWPEAARRSGYDISPCRDDRPFFLNFFRREQIPAILGSLGREWRPYGGLGFLLMFLILGFAIAASAALIWLPLGRSRGPRPTGWRHQMAYFFLIGMGYLCVEIIFIHRFILILARPTYSFAVVLSVLLVSSGAGSLLAERMAPPRRLRAVLAAVALAIVLVTVLMPPLTRLILPLGNAGRALAVAGLVAPVGFLMGIPLPARLSAVRRHHHEWTVPRAWAANGCASVIASVAAMIAAVMWGYAAVAAAAAVFYAAAALVLNAEVRAKAPPGNRDRPGVSSSRASGTPGGSSASARPLATPCRPRTCPH